MSVLHAAERPLRAAIVVLVIVAGGVALGAKPASAAGTGIFLACGYADQTGAAKLPSSGCEPLSQALTDAAAFASQSGKPVVIDLMPGLYCPVTLPPVTPMMTIIGVGTVGIASGVNTHPGPEAELSSFEWNTGSCAGTPTSLATTAGNTGSLTLANLAVAGSSGGPSNGVKLGGTVAILRDVLVENFTGGTGVSGSSMTIQNSAFNSNQIGVSVTGVSKIDESTIADNSADGIDLNDPKVTVATTSLVNDTIAHNVNGINVLSAGQKVKMANSIVGDNTTADCTGTVAQLDPDAPSGQGTNLVGAGCNIGDISLGTTTVADTFSTDGPTPAIVPPDAAEVGADPSECRSTGTDQREFIPPTGTCDIGSVDHGANGAIIPVAGLSSLDFGMIPTHQTATRSVTVSNVGGGVMGVTGASTTGRGYSVTANGCALTIVLNQVITSCTITVEAHPSTSTQINGTLTIHTTAGTILVKLIDHPAKDHSALRAPRVTRINYGAALTLSTRLTDSRTHNPIIGAKVKLMSRTAGTKQPFTPHVTTTDAHGVARVSVQPAENKQYEWLFKGISGHARTVTRVSTVLVRQLVTAALGRPKVHHRKPTTIFGTVSPKETGRLVVLQRLVAGRWKSVGVTAKIKFQRTTNHKKVLAFILSYKPRRSGTETLRVYRAATRTNAAGVSRRMRLRVS